MYLIENIKKSKLIIAKSNIDHVTLFTNVTIKKSPTHTFKYIYIYMNLFPSKMKFKFQVHRLLELMS